MQLPFFTDKACPNSCASCKTETPGKEGWQRGPQLPASELFINLCDVCGSKYRGLPKLKAGVALSPSLSPEQPQNTEQSLSHSSVAHPEEQAHPSLNHKPTQPSQATAHEEGQAIKTGIGPEGGVVDGGEDAHRNGSPAHSQPVEDCAEAKVTFPSPLPQMLSSSTNANNGAQGNATSGNVGNGNHSPGVPRVEEPRQEAQQQQGAQQAGQQENQSPEMKAGARQGRIKAHSKTKEMTAAAAAIQLATANRAKTSPANVVQAKPAVHKSSLFTDSVRRSASSVPKPGASGSINGFPGLKLNLPAIDGSGQAAHTGSAAQALLELRSNSSLTRLAHAPTPLNSPASTSPPQDKERSRGSPLGLDGNSAALTGVKRAREPETSQQPGVRADEYAASSPASPRLPPTQLQGTTTPTTPRSLPRPSTVPQQQEKTITRTRALQSKAVQVMQGANQQGGPQNGAASEEEEGGERQSAAYRQFVLQQQLLQQLHNPLQPPMKRAKAASIVPNLDHWGVRHVAVWCENLGCKSFVVPFVMGEVDGPALTGLARIGGTAQGLDIILAQHVPEAKFGHRWKLVEAILGLVYGRRPIASL